MSVKDWRPDRNKDEKRPIPIPPGPWRRHGKMRYKVIGNLGDTHPIDYGGFIVYVLQDPDRGEEYLEAEYWEEPLNENSNYEVYSFGIEDDPMRDLDWVKWEEIASSYGMDVSVIYKYAQSEDPLMRAEVYRMVGNYWGYDNFDSYPLKLTRSEMERRWPQYA